MKPLCVILFVLFIYTQYGFADHFMRTGVFRVACKLYNSDSNKQQDFARFRRYFKPKQNSSRLFILLFFKERLKIVSTLISSLPNKSYIKDKKAVEEIPFFLETIISEYTVIWHHLAQKKRHYPLSPSRHTGSDRDSGSRIGSSVHPSRGSDGDGRVGVKGLNNHFTRGYPIGWKSNSVLCGPRLRRRRWVCNIFFRQIKSAIRAWNEPFGRQWINTNLHLAMQVKTAQYRFRPCRIPHSLSLLPVDTNLHRKIRFKKIIIFEDGLIIYQVSGAFWIRGRMPSYHKSVLTHFPRDSKIRRRREKRILFRKDGNGCLAN